MDNTTHQQTALPPRSGTAFADTALPAHQEDRTLSQRVGELPERTCHRRPPIATSAPTGTGQPGGATLPNRRLTSTSTHRPPRRPTPLGQHREIIPTASPPGPSAGRIRVTERARP